MTCRLQQFAATFEENTNLGVVFLPATLIYSSSLNFGCGKKKSKHAGKNIVCFSLSLFLSLSLSCRLLRIIWFRFFLVSSLPSAYSERCASLFQSNYKVTGLEKRVLQFIILREWHKNNNHWQTQTTSTLPEYERDESRRRRRLLPCRLYTGPRMALHQNRHKSV